MSVSNEFLEYVLDQFREWGDVSLRKMFGGAGLFREGKMFGLVADDAVYLKVDDSNREKYEAAGSAPFHPWEDQPMIMSYWELPADILEDRDALPEWAAEAFEIQLKKK
ncbi:TfoX/Sxy family protein [Pontiella agarivorans]|uniref:TfoX/Sxy family protein n=1 Tax=Pontiella agarivorans TaxID=3038953 RepID=A0ABU5MZC6_9BACT|nr:TfoX/Sxy family protein [Pontiella agarivorans]MDZ8119509.1 TfoX/Sxy family protein [Pontiella agarivorans]